MSFIFNFSDPPTSFSIRASASPNSSVVTLLDYGAGNVRSVRSAIHSLGFSIKDVESPQDILNAERLVFPGVGAFAAAMDFINQNGRRMSTYLQKSKKEFGQMVWGFCPYQILANLSKEVKKELEDPQSRYNFGWSHGKEKLESGKPGA